MKKHTFIIAAAAMVMALAPASNSFAREKKKLDANTGNITVKYLESDDRYIYLQVNLLQQDEKPATFRVSDEFGELLYTDRIKSRNHIVTLKLTPGELEKISIELSTAEGTYRKKYALESKAEYTTGVKEVSSF
jgi:hypothetical protein